MAKTFLYIILAGLVLNAAIKTVAYVSYNKIPGTVVELTELSSISHTGKGTMKESAVAPFIAYTINGAKYRATDKKWGLWASYEINDIVTVMYSDYPHNVRINGFFQFWLTLRDIAVIFGLACIGTIIFETIKFYTKKSRN